MRVREHVLVLGYILTHDVIIHREILLICSITKNGLHQFFASGFNGVWLNFLDSSIRNRFFHLIIRFQALTKPIMTHGIITYITIEKLVHAKRVRVVIKSAIPQSLNPPLLASWRNTLLKNHLLQPVSICFWGSFCLIPSLHCFRHPLICIPLISPP